MSKIVSFLQSKIDKLAPREQRLVTGLGCTLLLAIIWALAIAPVLQTWRASEAAHAKLDAELVQMQLLEAESKILQSLPIKTAAQAQAWLESSIKKLGKATMSTQNGRIQINFNNASADYLNVWLIEARTTAALLPLEAHWTRQNSNKTGSPAGNQNNEKSVLWDGVVLFELPK